MPPIVAVVGVTGRLGAEVLDALCIEAYNGSYMRPIRAFTRDPQRMYPRPEVEFYNSDFADIELLCASLIGVDVVIDLTANCISSIPLIDAAADMGVSLFFLSDYSIIVPAEYSVINATRHRDIQHARSKQLMKSVAIKSGVFADNLLKLEQFNLNIEGSHLQFTTTWIADIAKFVAQVASTSPQSLPEVIKIHGDSVSLNQISRPSRPIVTWTETKYRADESARRLKQCTNLSRAEKLQAITKIFTAILVNPYNRSLVDYSKSNSNSLADITWSKWHKI
ncbi:hypothetical protein TRICI_001988 [Trichomonascus ciferrii]|uniref:NmrA-like domain-containing protein n=1 Tax=Trichomonascus ciferrii TaxID=44093 RepID=A0A642V7X3_9ASCO|nr:hypothetical protein TRICI_001988 [Trichomonascus ciferrii]